MAQSPAQHGALEGRQEGGRDETAEELIGRKAHFFYQENRREIGGPEDEPRQSQPLYAYNQCAGISITNNNSTDARADLVKSAEKPCRDERGFARKYQVLVIFFGGDFFQVADVVGAMIACGILKLK